MKIVIPAVDFLNQEKYVSDEKITAWSIIENKDQYVEVKVIVIKDASKDGAFFDVAFGEKQLVRMYAKFTVQQDGFLKIGDESGPMDEIAGDLHDLMIKKKHCYLMTMHSDAKVSLKCVTGGSQAETAKPFLRDIYENFPTYPDARFELGDDERLIYFGSIKTEQDKKLICVLSIDVMPEGVKGNSGVFAAFENSVENTVGLSPSLFVAIDTNDKSNKNFEILNYSDTPRLGDPKIINELIHKLLELKPYKFIVTRKVDNKITLKTCD